VFAVGLSMGGLLSLLLAAEERVDAAVVVGVPLRLPWPVRAAVPLLWRLRPHLRKAGGSDIQDADARARHPSLPVMPLRGVRELLRLQRVARRALPRIKVPILVAHGALDRTANPRDAAAILAAVASSETARFECARSGHVVPVDHDGPALAEAVAEFLTKQSVVPTPRSMPVAPG
jgi:carboxylesterase